MKRKILSRKFFERDAKVVARELLGKFLVRRHYSLIPACRQAGVRNKRIVRRRKDVACMIIETEAYDGLHDKASHAHRGRTKRNEPMFGEAGVWYVYLCYGMHEMLNIVTGPKEYPAAVLVRDVVSASGRSDGPGRVTKALKISRAFNNKKATRVSGLWIEDRGVKITPRDISRAARIGVSYAGSAWSKKPYRFYIKDSHS